MSNVARLDKLNSNNLLTVGEIQDYMQKGFRPYFTNSWQFVKCNKDTARAIASKCVTKGYWFFHRQCEHNPKFVMFILPAAIDFTKDIIGNSKIEFVATVIPGEHMTQDKFSGKSAA